MHCSRLNMHAAKEGARLRCPSSWVQLTESICNGSLLLYFQYFAMTNYARERIQMLLINQGSIGQTFLIIVKTMPQVVILPKFQWEILKAHAEKCLCWELEKPSDKPNTDNSISLLFNWHFFVLNTKGLETVF